MSAPSVSAIGEWFTKSIGEFLRAAFNLLVLDNDYHHLNYALAKAGVAIGTTVTKVTTANAISVVAGGVFSAQKAATPDEFTLGVAGSNTLVAVSSINKYLLFRDVAGVATVLEGTQVAAALGAADVQFPAMPAGKACIGFVTVTTDATHTFIPGTTAFNAAGITAVFTDGLDLAMLRTMQVNKSF